MCPPHLPEEGDDFRLTPSMVLMGSGRGAFVVGFDTEFTNVGSGSGAYRVIDSYQFATVDPFDPGALIQVVVLPPLGSRYRLPLSEALWIVMCAARLYDAPTTRPNGKPLVRDGVGAYGVVPEAVRDCVDFEERCDALAKHGIPIVLATHYANADITTFFDSPGGYTDILKRCNSVGGGLVTLRPMRVQDDRHFGGHTLAFSTNVRDSMAHAPAGKQSLKALGEVCGVDKLTVPDNQISNMTLYRREHFDAFLEYGINDSVIVVEYLARLWGDFILPPISLSSAAASLLVAKGVPYFLDVLGIGVESLVGRGESNQRFFSRIFSGLVITEDVISEDDGGMSFYTAKGKAPVDSGTFMRSCAWAYHGGLNSCPRPGYYPLPTWDVDAQNAYPTAMALVEDVDYTIGDVIYKTINKKELTLDDVPSPTCAFVGFVSFEFPESVKHPCIPILADNTLIYPRTSKGVAGTWCMAAEIWLALKLGARVFCELGHHATVLKDRDGHISRFLRVGVKQLIDDRTQAKAKYGKGSLEELVFKTCVNSIYGKTAQDVSEQKSWNAFVQEYEDVGGSAITSSYHAAQTTSLVRAQLLAVMNQLEDAGWRVFSVTTDGFITDAPLDAVNECDLYGMKELLEDARVALTGNPSIWEVKHEQNDLLNFTTRGNVSLQPTGVLAHAGLKTPDGIERDSLQDREWLLTIIATRAGRVTNSHERFPSFKNLSLIENRQDFLPCLCERSLSMDYDLKRCPVMDAMSDANVVLPNGGTAPFACFDTRAWESVGDAVRGRRLARELAKDDGLVVRSDWERWSYLFRNKRRVTSDFGNDVLRTIMILHRQGVVDIPCLSDEYGTVAARLEGLACLGFGVPTINQWKDARKPERQSSALPLEEVEPYIECLGGEFVCSRW